MAKIKIENVPEVATISKLLGVDSNNKWAKINGGAYSTPADVAEAIKPVKQSADNAVAAANAAMNTANAAKATADGIAGTANDAKTAAKEAKVDANEAKKKADILYGMARSIYEVPLEESQDYSVSALWFCNGLADPTSTKPPTSLTGAYGTIVCFPGNSAEVKLRLLALAEIPDDTTAEFECITNAAKLTLYAGTTELGYFTRSDGEAAFAYSCKIVNRGIFHIYAMAGCTFTATYSGNSYAMLVSVGGGGSATVDSELSTTSENPVQNKAIAEAINLYDNKTNFVLTGNNQTFSASSGWSSITITVDSGFDIPVNKYVCFRVLCYRYLGTTNLNLTLKFKGKEYKIAYAGMELGNYYIINAYFHVYAETNSLLSTIQVGVRNN